MDEVDHILNEAENEINVSLLKQQSATHSSTVIVYDYFNSSEASILFAPKMDETVTECLVRRIELLGEGTSDDHVLNMLCTEGESSNITKKV